MVVRTPDALITIIRGKTAIRLKKQDITDIRFDLSRSRVVIHSVSPPQLCRPSCIVAEYILDPDILHTFVIFIHEWW